MMTLYAIVHSVGTCYVALSWCVACHKAEPYVACDVALPYVACDVALPRVACVSVALTNVVDHAPRRCTR